MQLFEYRGHSEYCKVLYLRYEMSQMHLKYQSRQLSQPTVDLNDKQPEWTAQSGVHTSTTF